VRGGAGRSWVRLVFYPLAVLLLPVSASAAYVPPPTPLATITLTGRMAGTGAGMRPATQTAVAEATIQPLPPITTALAPSAFDRLKDDLAAIAAGSGGRVGVALQELSGPRRNSLSINGDQQFYAASAYKLPLLMAEAQAIVNGQVSPSDVLCFNPSDQEDGWFDDYAVGSCFTRQQLSERAGRYSDNTAAHILVRYLGGPDALNRFARSAGMANSALWDPNDTTVQDLASIWVNEALGRLGGTAAQQWLYPILTHTSAEQGIPAGVPASVTVVHKVGTMYGSENDSAYVTNGRITYVLSVAVDGTDEATGWAVIARVSARIWAYEISRPDFVAPVIANPAPPAWADRRQ
jgi:beta-lactamase class A